MTAALQNVNFSSTLPVAVPTQQPEARVKDLRKDLNSAQPKSDRLQKILQVALAVAGVALYILGILSWSPLFLIVGTSVYFLQEALSYGIRKKLSNC
jgi:hypothetical protein